MSLSSPLISWAEWQSNLNYLVQALLDWLENYYVKGSIKPQASCIWHVIAMKSVRGSCLSLFANINKDLNFILHSLCHFLISLSRSLFVCLCHNVHLETYSTVQSNSQEPRAWNQVSFVQVSDCCYFFGGYGRIIISFFCTHSLLRQIEEHCKYFMAKVE